MDNELEAWWRVTCKKCGAVAEGKGESIRQDQVLQLCCGCPRDDLRVECGWEKANSNNGGA